MVFLLISFNKTGSLSSTFPKIPKAFLILFLKNKLLLKSFANLLHSTPMAYLQFLDSIAVITPAPLYKSKTTSSLLQKDKT